MTDEKTITQRESEIYEAYEKIDEAISTVFADLIRREK